ncbi:MAG TPA: hypothetical protein VN688_05705 [Gemmataceae bacterium]|nr:hypothetical protein [Gemmataceae bacterium]
MYPTNQGHGGFARHLLTEHGIFRDDISDVRERATQHHAIRPLDGRVEPAVEIAWAGLRPFRDHVYKQDVAISLQVFKPEIIPVRRNVLVDEPDVSDRHEGRSA